MFTLMNRVWWHHCMVWLPFQQYWLAVGKQQLGQDSAMWTVHGNQNLALLPVTPVHRRLYGMILGHWMIVTHSRQCWLNSYSNHPKFCPVFVYCNPTSSTALLAFVNTTLVVLPWLQTIWGHSAGVHVGIRDKAMYLHERKLINDDDSPQYEWGPTELEHALYNVWNVVTLHSFTSLTSFLETK